MILDGVRINYGIIDQTIDIDNINGSATSNSDFSAIENTLKKSNKQKIAYLEKDYFLLDGTAIMPVDGERYDVGWESSDIADASGVINEEIQYLFGQKHDSYGIQIEFFNGSVPKNFTISYYDDSLLIGSSAVVDNTAVLYQNYDVRLQWNKVVISFTKVNPYQRARMNSITFGVNDVYDEDMLISVSASRSTDLAGEYDDCGEFSFQFYNEGRFNIKDINDLPIGLQEGLKVVVYIKKKGEKSYIPFSHYLSDKTNVLENGQVVTVSGYDELYRLNDTIYAKGIVYPQGRSLKAWAEEVAADANISLTIDDVFDTMISTGYITEVPHREALRLIAEAGCGILTSDADGNWFLKKHVSRDVGVITNDEIVVDTLAVENSEKYLGIQVQKFTFSAAKEEQELGYLEEIGLTSEPQEIEIVYSAYPAIVSTIQVFVDTSTSATILEKKIYSDRVLVTISGTDGDATFVTVTGKPYNSVTQTVTKGSVLKNIKTIENNYLITGSLADNVADYQFERVINKYDYTAEVVTEKDIELGDGVNLGSGTNTRANNGDRVFITKRAFSVSYGEQVQTIGAVDE